MVAEHHHDHCDYEFHENFKELASILNLQLGLRTEQQNLTMAASSIISFHAELKDFVYFFVLSENASSSLCSLKYLRSLLIKDIVLPSQKHDFII